MAQAVIHTALKFGGIFHLNNINPLQGVGSQLQPHNVWANPAYWPFAILDSPLALDVSALVALGCLALACYIMARCFDVPVLPSIMAAQLSIVLFGPLAYLLIFYQVFWINPGIAVVYAPQLVALGIIARLEPGRIRDFIFVSGSRIRIASLQSDLRSALDHDQRHRFAAAFAVVTLSPLRVRPILIRCAALGCCLALLLISGAIGYLYTLSQYSGRVWFSDALAYVPQAFLASIVFISPKTMGCYYGLCALGWVLGTVFARGRVRVLVMAGLVSFGFIVVYGGTFLLMRKWWWPLPLYIEHSLFPLFTTSAVAGYWAALGRIKLPLFLLIKVRGKLASLMPIKQPFSDAIITLDVQNFSHAISDTCRLVGCTPCRDVSPLRQPRFTRSVPPRTAPNFDEPFPNEPELVRYFEEAIGLRVGGEFRGSVMLYAAPSEPTMPNLWIYGIPTVNEYSQLLTPQALYFSAALFKHDIVLGDLNQFVPWIATDATITISYSGRCSHLACALSSPSTAFTQPTNAIFPLSHFHVALLQEPGNWVVYELPNPNVGNYSPTEVMTAKSGPEIIAALGAPHFDFTKQVVLSTAIDEPLVPAHNMRLSLIRGGLHVSGSSDGTSLVVLPQQFSHCLRPRDTRVRLVRANLLMTGVVFSGNIDTDIVFDYGIFSPGCRRLDLAELRQLIAPRAPTDERIFVDWDGLLARLRDAGIALGLVAQEPQPEPTPSEEPAPSGPAITTETVLADLPPLTTSSFAFIGIQGLNAEVEAGKPVVAGQPIVRLVAIPTSGRHYFAAQSTTLKKNQVYRITAWIKDPAGVKVQMEVSDELRPRGGTPANYGSAIFNPGARTVSRSPGHLKGTGIEQGPEGWQKIWVDLTTAGGEMVVAFASSAKTRANLKATVTSG